MYFFLAAGENRIEIIKTMMGIVGCFAIGIEKESSCGRSGGKVEYSQE